MAQMSKVAAGTIRPSRFVKLDVTADGKVLEADAGEPIYGISQKGTRNVPYSTLDDGNAAIAGENVHIFGPGEKCSLQLGGTVAVGDRLKSDADGKGVATTTDLDEYGAIAQQAGVLDEIVEVFVTFPTQVSAV